MFMLNYAIYWLFLAVSAFAISRSSVRKKGVLAAITIGIYLIALACLCHLEPWQRLFLSTIGLLHTIKWACVLVSPHVMTPAALLMYMTFWPGMQSLERKESNPVSQDDEKLKLQKSDQRFNRGYVLLWCGVLLAVAVALNFDRLGAIWVGWLGLISLLMIIHLGYADVLSACMLLGGWNVTPLFDRPWAARDMRDFWSRRWNHAFVEMNHVLFLPALGRWMSTNAAVFGVFLISGFLHELAISYSAGSGWGLPMAYFALQGGWMLLEHHMRNHGANKVLLRILTYCCIVLPIPLCLTEPFRNAFIVPLFGWAHNLLTSHELGWYIGIALYCAAVGNFCTMIAGIQVPARLNWKEELQRISKFNRKILINYYFYIGTLVGAWGLSTCMLHDDMMAGQRAALWLAGLIALFWSGRVIVDFTYFKPEDWPAGPELVVGRALLTTLFIMLAVTYWSVIAWRVVAF